MRRLPAILLLPLCAVLLFGKAKPHSVTWGQPLTVQLFVGPAEDQALPMTVRPLYVDGVQREFITGEAHTVTDRTFVVRRAFRVNDLLPSEEETKGAKNVAKKGEKNGAKKTPAWRWQRGGWLVVDRTTGHVARLALPGFDPYYSNATWFRDYAAYCGLASDAAKVYAIVVQLGEKRPLLRKELGAARGADLPDSECGPPAWQRAPVRVTFSPTGKPAVSFEVHGRWAEPAEDAAPEPPQ
jgi:hypothetical protein